MAVGTHQGVAGLCLCCLCNKLARHWFPPKTPHKATSSGPPRELPGSLPGPSRWEKRPGRIMVMVMYIAPACSSACTTGAHLCICRPIGGHLSSSSARAVAATRVTRLSFRRARVAPLLRRLSRPRLAALHVCVGSATSRPWHAGAAAWPPAHRPRRRPPAVYAVYAVSSLDTG